MPSPGPTRLHPRLLRRPGRGRLAPERVAPDPFGRGCSRGGRQHGARGGACALSRARGAAPLHRRTRPQPGAAMGDLQVFAGAFERRHSPVCERHVRGCSGPPDPAELANSGATRGGRCRVRSDPCHGAFGDSGLERAIVRAGRRRHSSAPVKKARPLRSGLFVLPLPWILAARSAVMRELAVDDPDLFPDRKACIAGFGENACRAVIEAHDDFIM